MRPEILIRSLLILATILWSGWMLWGFASGAPLVAPFLILYGLIVLAGAVGGVVPGAVAGLVGAAVVLICHSQGYGPRTLTGNLVFSVTGAVLFALTGTLLGRMRDRNRHSLGAANVAARLHQTALEEAAKMVGLGYYVFDARTGQCEICSPEYAAIYGMTPEEYMARVTNTEGWQEFFHPDDIDAVRSAYAAAMEEGGARIEARLVIGGELRHILSFITTENDASGRLRRVVGCTVDVTAERLAAESAQQARKLEGLGQLTAGIAHDFNNILAVILGYGEILTGKLKDDPDTLDAARQIVAAAEHGSGLSRNLLGFAQQAELEPETCATDALLDQAGSLLRPALGDGIQLVLDTTGEPGHFLADRSQLHAALLNLAINARDAMPAGGTVTLAARRETVDAAAAARLGIAPGDYAALAMVDTGTGMPADVLERARDPFFTTKKRAHGSGLGLSIVSGFMTQSGGALDLTSEEGLGTRARMLFPIAAVDGTVPRPVADTAVLPPLRVMLVDDNPQICAIIEDHLGELGMSVSTWHEAESAEQAFEVGKFDIAILDNVLPGEMQGVELARNLRHAAPDLGIIIQSGDLEVDPDTMSGIADAWLRKPVTRQELSGVLARVSSARAAAE